MDNLSTASTDISSQIGALELGDNLESHDDGVLESAGAYLNPPPQPTQVRTGCGLPPTIVACRIDDGALESARADMIQPVTSGFGCRQTVQCVSDGALLRAADTTMSGQPPTAHSGGCTILRGSCATDGVLESAGANMTQPVTSGFGCRQTAWCVVAG